MSSSKSKTTIGFLTVLEFDSVGSIGGYLILNIGARPLEFHCTSPVKANRAQEILYGNTLKPYLHGEVVSTALVSKASIKPDFVLVNDVTLAMDGKLGCPRLWLQRLSETPPPASQFQSVDIERWRCCMEQGMDLDGLQVAETLSQLYETVDLDEPFQRIQSAIEEARRGARAA